MEYDSDLEAFVEAFVPSPLLDPLRNAPRFARLEAAMNLD